MRLNIEIWQPFVLSRLFDIKKGKRLTSEDQTEGHYIYIGAIDSNNGVAAHIGQEPIHEGNTISLSYNGSVGEAFYQAEAFWATDDVNVLYPRFKGFNRDIGLFISTVLRLEKIRFSYGRKWTLENMQNTVIKLPVLIDSSVSYIIDDSHLFSDEGYIPDWQFMEDYIKSLHYKPISTQNERNDSTVSVNGWKEFKVGDFFDIRPTKAIDGLTADDCTQTGVPLVVNSAENNGIAGFCDREATEDGNIITFSDTTEGNTFFYQPGPFIGFAHVQGMYPKTREWSSYELLYFLTVLMFDSKDRFSYGRKMRRDIISETKIKLPQTSNGTPDWQYMEDYIKSLPYGDRI